MSARVLRHLRPTPFLCRARLTREAESRVLKPLVLDPHGTARNVRQPRTAGLGSPGSLCDSTVSTEPVRPQRTTMGWPLAIGLSHPVLTYRPQKQLDKSRVSEQQRAVICHHPSHADHAAAALTGCGPTEFEVAFQRTLGSKRLGSTCCLLLSVMENRESIRVSLRLWGWRPRSIKREWTAL